MCEGMEYIHIDQDRVQWRTLVYKLTNLPFPQKAGNILTKNDVISLFPPPI
jgi:hypothetical protein